MYMVLMPAKVMSCHLGLHRNSLLVLTAEKCLYTIGYFLLLYPPHFGTDSSYTVD